MSESDGLQKLTAYLNQTRRQAEAAVDALNVQIASLRQENEAYEAICKELEEEKEVYRNQVEQLKQEGTMKHRLQERDDWRSLIDSVQKDRSRLQEECNTLETALEMAREEIAALQEELETFKNVRQDADPCEEEEPFSRTSSPGIRSQRGSATMGSGSAEETNGISMLSPIFDRNGNEVSINFSETPRNIVGQLKLELKKAYAQVSSIYYKIYSALIRSILFTTDLTHFLTAVDDGAPTGRSGPIGTSLGGIASARRIRCSTSSVKSHSGLREGYSERPFWQRCTHDSI